MLEFRPGIKWLWLTLVVVILDLSTKNLVSQHLQIHVPVVLTSWFNLTLLHNNGAAFGFLGDAGGWQRWFFICLVLAVSVFIVIWLYELKSNQRWMSCALALILGGALGNLWDRVTLGYVIDFIDISLGFLPWKIFNPWPTFNIADSAISIGTTILLIDAIWFSSEVDSSRLKD